MQYSAAGRRSSVPHITGIWQAGAGGGTARLAIGTVWGVRHGSLPEGSPLRQATHFLLSPDRRLLATDPEQGLWVAKPDGRAGRFLPVHLSRRCVIASFMWLPDSAGLAYLQVCPIAGRGIQAQATLFSVRLDGSPPVRLFRATSSDEPVIVLGSSYRCVLCGY